MDTMQWANRAACRAAPPELFFGPTDNGSIVQARSRQKQPDEQARIARARQVCSHCPVFTNCFSYAMQHPETYGIWGGTTRVQRSDWRRRTDRAAVRPRSLAR